ncbi:hypothetical protein ACHAXR_005591 [Thalassiosira sp. AJA248-18]
MDMDEFKRYKKSLDGIGEGGDTGKAYFKKATRVFFERFRFVWGKHIASKWLDSSNLHYITGGDKHHARAFCKWIVEYKETLPEDAVEDDGGMQIEVGYFSNEDITLGSHHTMSREEPIIVNLRESMEYITSEADREIILQTPFVKDSWSLIKDMAEFHEPVDLFQLFDKNIPTIAKRILEKD